MFSTGASIWKTSEVLLKIRGLEGWAMVGLWELLRLSQPTWFMSHEFDVWFCMVYASYTWLVYIYNMCVWVCECTSVHIYIMIYSCVCVFSLKHVWQWERERYPKWIRPRQCMLIGFIDNAGGRWLMVRAGFKFTRSYGHLIRYHSCGSLNFTSRIATY